MEPESRVLSDGYAGSSQETAHEDAQKRGDANGDPGTSIREVRGEERRRLYFVWRKMVARCHAPGDPAFARYGGRGIAVCERWRISFQSFLDDMSGDARKGLELDRIDNDGPYAPNNCRWATHTENQQNTRKSRRVTAFGETLTLRAWSRRIGVHHSTIARRLGRGVPAEEALR